MTIFRDMFYTASICYMYIKSFRLHQVKLIYNSLTLVQLEKVKTFNVTYTLHFPPQINPNNGLIYTNYF